MDDIIGHGRPKVMRRMAAALLATLFVLLLSARPEAASTTATAATGARDDIQATVAQQLDAFKSRNSEQAYAVVSEKFREKYKTPLRFVTMMRVNFWGLYNHAGYRFLGQNGAGDDRTLQKVEITDDAGTSSIYLFGLTRSPTGEWLIETLIRLDPEGQPA